MKYCWIQLNKSPNEILVVPGPEKFWMPWKMSQKWICRKTSLTKFEVRKNWRPWTLWLSSSWGLLTDALPKLWKDSILNCRGHLIDFCIFDFHLAKKDNLHCLNKLGSRELYQFKFLKSTENQLHRYATKNFSTILVLSGIQYILTSVITTDKLRGFLFVIKTLFKLKKVKSPLCSFCKEEDISQTENIKTLNWVISFKEINFWEIAYS